MCLICIKIFCLFKKLKSGPVNGLIKYEEINAISDEEAIKFLNKLEVKSLLDYNCSMNEIYLQKILFGQIEGFIACIGRSLQLKKKIY